MQLSYACFEIIYDKIISKQATQLPKSNMPSIKSAITRYKKLLEKGFSISNTGELTIEYIDEKTEIPTFEDEKDGLCPICYSELYKELPRTLMKTKCGHSFHMECLIKWALTKANDNIYEGNIICPMCRQSNTIWTIMD